jgi:hypothetical protein
VLLTSSGQLLLAVVLVAQAAAGLRSTWLLYAIVACQAGLFAVESPARQAFVPRLLRAGLLPAANALKQVEFNLAVTLGPLLAGLLVARYGYAWAYGLDAVSFGAALLAVRGLPAMPPLGGGRRAGTASVLEGLRFLRSRQVLLMTFVVDLVAMVFAMPRALFPALAEQVYGGGEQTAGLLYSALAVGALGWRAVLRLAGPGPPARRRGARLHRRLGARDHAVRADRPAVAGAAVPGRRGPRGHGVGRLPHGDPAGGRARRDARPAGRGPSSSWWPAGPGLGDARAGGGAELVGLQGASVAGGLAVVGITAAVAAGARRFRGYDAREPDVEVRPLP